MGVPPFQETPISIYVYIYIHIHIYIYTYIYIYRDYNMFEMCIFFCKTTVPCCSLRVFPGLFQPFCPSPLLKATPEVPLQGSTPPKLAPTAIGSPSPRKDNQHVYIFGGRLTYHSHKIRMYGRLMRTKLGFKLMVNGKPLIWHTYGSYWDSQIWLVIVSLLKKKNSMLTRAPHVSG